MAHIRSRSRCARADGNTNLADSAAVHCVPCPRVFVTLTECVVVCVVGVTHVLYAHLCPLNCNFKSIDWGQALFHTYTHTHFKRCAYIVTLTNTHIRTPQQATNDTYIRCKQLPIHMNDMRAMT